MIYSTQEWLDEFGRRLAESDAEYFEQINQRERDIHSHRSSRTNVSRVDEARRKAIEDADRELTEAGI